MGDTLDMLERDIERYVERHGSTARLPHSAKLRILLSSPGLLAIALYRFGNWILQTRQTKRNRPKQFALSFLFYLGTFASRVLFKIVIRRSASIGAGLHLSNKGYIILGPKTMGPGCTIDHDVTIGQGRDGGLPEFGSGVVIGHNAIVYGDIKIGNGAVIEPSSVVSKSVPEGCVVAGNPGRIVRRSIHGTS